MNSRLRTILIATLALAFLGSAMAGDWHLRLRLPVVEAVTDRLPTSRLGGRLHRAQERVHEVVTRTTGVRVPHSYLWLHLGKTSIPIDPINFSK